MQRFWSVYTHFRAPCKERLRGVRLPVSRGDVERRLSVSRGCVDWCAGLEEGGEGGMGAGGDTAVEMVGVGLDDVVDDAAEEGAFV